MKLDFMKNGVWAIALLIILSSYLFFCQLGKLPLTDPDESFYAQTAKEMVQKNEWLTPYLYGKPQFEKPILFYWLVEVSFRAFRVNEFAARLPSALFGLAGVIATYFLASLLFNRRSALFSALILATSLEYLVLARACVTDMALGVFVILAFLFFADGYKNGRRASYLFSSAFLALAVLTKGPIGIMLPAAVILLFLLAAGDLKSAIRMPLLQCAAIFLAVALPWYLIAYHKHGKDFIDVFFGFHNIARFLEPEHKSGERFYYYVPVVLGGLFPWSAFLPYGIAKSIKASLGREGGADERCSHIFLLIWFAVIFAFFSVSRTKLVTYIFPAFAPLAIIVGVLWDRFLEGAKSNAMRKGMSASYYLFFAVTVVAAAGLFVFLKRRYPTLLAGSLVSGAFLALGIISSLIAFLKKRYAASFGLVILSIVVFLFFMNNLVLPEIGRYESSREMAEKLLSFMKEGERIGAESNYVPGVTFYTGREVKDVDRHHDLVTLLGSEERVWCVLKEKNHIQLYTLDTRPYYTKPSYMVYKLGKKCIITNKVPENGHFLAMRERR